MKKMYSEMKNWDKSHWKKSFENLAKDGYKFDRIETKSWFVPENWVTSVLVNKTAHKVIKESEKALCFSVVNQYGNSYEIWFPKSVLISY